MTDTCIEDPGGPMDDFVMASFARAAFVAVTLVKLATRTG
jgi:hypothetical protein